MNEKRTKAQRTIIKIIWFSLRVNIVQIITLDDECVRDTISLALILANGSHEPVSVARGLSDTRSNTAPTS